MHPGVESVGLTTTSGGDWALMVRLRDLADAPIPEIEQRADGAPVVYTGITKRPEARPAYPKQGE